MLLMVSASNSFVSVSGAVLITLGIVSGARQGCG